MASFSKPVRTEYPDEQRLFLLRHFSHLRVIMRDLLERWQDLCVYSYRLFIYPVRLMDEMIYFVDRIIHHLELGPYRHEDVLRLGSGLSGHYYGRYQTLGSIANRIFHNGGFSYENLHDCYESWRNESTRTSVPEIIFGHPNIGAVSSIFEHHEFVSLFIFNAAFCDPQYVNFRQMITPKRLSYEDSLTDRQLRRLDEEITVMEREEAAIRADRIARGLSVSPIELPVEEPGRRGPVFPLLEQSPNNQNSFLMGRIRRLGRDHSLDGEDVPRENEDYYDIEIPILPYILIENAPFKRFENSFGQSYNRQRNLHYITEARYFFIHHTEPEYQRLY